MEKKDRQTFRAWSLVLQVGISMMAPIFFGVLLGRWLDGKFGTDYLMLVFLGLGILAGIRNTYVLLKAEIERIRKGDKKE